MKTSITTLILFLILSLSTTVFSQDHFLVELPKRTPDVATMVRSYEGTAVIPVMANDIEGKEQFIGNYQGDNLILYFWKIGNPRSVELLNNLNLLKQKYSDLNVVSFALDSKEDLLAFTQSFEVNFPIIPNAEILSEGPYGGELGMPKLFFIDDKGITKWVFPAQELNGAMDVSNILSILHEQVTH
jgi:hypothetical protein